MLTLVWLAVLLSSVTLGQKGKTNVKLICFQKISALKKIKTSTKQ